MEECCECLLILCKIIFFPFYLCYCCVNKIYEREEYEPPRPRRRIPRRRNYETIDHTEPETPHHPPHTLQPSRPAQHPRTRPQTNPTPQRQPRTAPAPQHQPRTTPAPQQQPRTAPAPQQRPRPNPTRSIASNDHAVDVYAGNEETVYLCGDSESVGLLYTEEECYGIATDREAYGARIQAGLYVDEDGDVSAMGIISEMYTDGNNVYQQDTIVQLDEDDFDSSDSSDDNLYY